MTRLKKYAIKRYRELCRNLSGQTMAKTFEEMDRLAQVLGPDDQIDVVVKVLCSGEL